MAICTAIATVALTGCREEELFDNGQRVEEGIPTRISLGYASQESTVEIRSAQETDYENRDEYHPYYSQYIRHIHLHSQSP